MVLQNRAIYEIVGPWPLFLMIQSLYLTLWDRRDRAMGATDPRDRIFAILSLVENDDGLYPDYSQTCEEVYSKTAAAFIRSITQLSSHFSKLNERDRSTSHSLLRLGDDQMFPLHNNRQPLYLQFCEPSVSQFPVRS